MDSVEDLQNNCRICLEQPAPMDWNEEIYDSYSTTYKYCYYKYTQLDDNVPDDYSQMLCETCAYNLKSFHFLIQKALESYNILQQTYCQTSEIEYKIDIENQTEDAAEFETVILKKPTESSTDDDDNKDMLQSCFVEALLEKERVDKKSKDLKKNRVNKTAKNKNFKLENHDDFPKDVEVNIDIPHSVEEEITDIQSLSADKPVLHKNRKIACAYCATLIIAYKMKAHEQTHATNRERSETCTKCGVKFFNKSALYSHMSIHEENREKRHKCDFCEKAYYNRSGLNIHRRLHLGQLIPCPICSKEFYRQVDLEKHKARTHFANIQNKNYTVNKYFVECKDCGKNIISHRWKHHSLLHSNTMQMKCTLCNKHFASKQSCHSHVRKVHKYKDKVSNVVEYYGDKVNKHTSHLMLSQLESVKPILK